MAEAITALTDLGLFSYIGVGATIFVAGLLWKRFRR